MVVIRLGILTWHGFVNNTIIKTLYGCLIKKNCDVYDCEIGIVILDYYIYKGILTFNVNVNNTTVYGCFIKIGDITWDKCLIFTGI